MFGLENFWVNKNPNFRPNKIWPKNFESVNFEFGKNLGSENVWFKKKFC